jgi:alginate O-acetyltransferase complex protein AlgI
MLFNSYPFLFLFLPVTLIGYEIAGRFHRRAVVAWLGLASLAFYAYWKPIFLVLLLSSIAFNYLSASLISRKIPNSVSSRVWLWLAIGGNLAALCYYKYLFPALRYAGHRIGWHHHWANVALPLGISFFTFTQIAYLVDLQQGIATLQDPFSFLLFVTFFPHLIAGPILHHKDIMPQFQQTRRYRLQFNDLAVGATWFTMGLFKKVVFADSLAWMSTIVFNANAAVSPTAAWLGVLSYAMQLYFDFSGYCDMACGLARMFSIDFPLNFSSPFKATNIIDFWARWHITLTDYITNYLYSPLQMIISRRRQEQGKKVSRKAQATPEGFTNMIAIPTLTVMFIAGVWHGAGTQFIIFGLLHGIYITTVHAWRTFFRKKEADAAPQSSLRRKVNHVCAVALTFAAVVLADVFFRAPSTHQALRLLRRMLGLHVAITGKMVPFGSLARPAGMLLIAAVIVWSFPNTQQILARYKPALELTRADGQKRLLPIYWNPTLAWGIATALVFMIGLVHSQDPSTFLYFQF